MGERYLNVDIGGSVSELRAFIKEFELKSKLKSLLRKVKGLEFESYKEYSPGDDASVIDWKASKRANKILVRQFVEEKNLRVMFLVDVGESMVSGSSDKLKCEYAAEIVSAFAHLISSSGDKFGFILFSDDVKKFIRPSGGDRHFRTLVNEITDPLIYSGVFDLNKSLDFMLNYLKGDISSVVFLSDFISFDEESGKKLALVARKFETIALMIRDPLDGTLPDFLGEITIEDPVTGSQLVVNPKIARNVYEKLSLQQKNLVKNSFFDKRVDLVELATDKPFAPVLSSFLKERTRR